MSHYTVLGGKRGCYLVLKAGCCVVVMKINLQVVALKVSFVSTRGCELLEPMPCVFNESMRNRQEMQSQRVNEGFVFLG